LDLRPEFGRDGSPPPITSTPVKIADWSLNKSVAKFVWAESYADKHDPSLRLFPIVATALFFGTLGRFGPFGRRGTKRSREDVAARETREMYIRRLIESSHLTWREVEKWQMYALHDHFWQREDPVTQLPPGSTSEITMSLRIGISEEHATELARSLGVKGAVPHAGISAALSDKASSKIAVSQESEAIRKITLTNPRDRTYRRLAIWHVVHRVSIVAMPQLTSNQKIACEENEFILSDATNVTFMDVDRP